MRVYISMGAQLADAYLYLARKEEFNVVHKARPTLPARHTNQQCGLAMPLTLLPLYDHDPLMHLLPAPSAQYV